MHVNIKYNDRYMLKKFMRNANFFVFKNTNQ